MTWKDILKAHCGTEKMGCGCADCEKQQFEKKLVGNQKRIDADKDGKITGKDFAMLRNKKMKKSDMPSPPKSRRNLPMTCKNGHNFTVGEAHQKKILGGGKYDLSSRCPICGEKAMFKR